DCIYFAVITLTTAGLGDLVPTTDGAKIICSIFIYFGVACIGLLLGSYIAGMLDERSYREAIANQIKACPNYEIGGRKNSTRNAKYVVLTLREALINSLVIIAFGCLGFYLIEGLSLVDSWYFTTVLLTSTGYGDIVPKSDGGKLFATVYLLVAGTILLNNMSMISMIPLELRKRRTEQALATGPLIHRINLDGKDSRGLDECTREMFALAMMIRLGKVTEVDIKQTFAAFRKLDVNNEGVLNSKSIIG
ncbi:hypothetical protein FRACYDRAFT_160610, partial [Fragilariopsis cylindrus CCMP1102]